MLCGRKLGSLIYNKIWEEQYLFSQQKKILNSLKKAVVFFSSEDADILGSSLEYCT